MILNHTFNLNNVNYFCYCIFTFNYFKMTDNYPIDMNAARNSKLFKKFKEGRNKSHSALSPKLTQIKFQQKEHNFSNNSFQNAHSKSIVALPSNNGNQPTELEKYRSKTKKSEGEYVRGIIHNQHQQNRVKEQFSEQIEVKKYDSFQHNWERADNIELKNEIEQGEQKKYKKLLLDYEQLKETMIQERKKHLKDHYHLQEEVQAVKKKNFEIRMHEDELIHENNKLKEKIASELKLNKVLQEENQQITYKLQQLEDMLQGKDNAIKKRFDEVDYWRKMTLSLKDELNNAYQEKQALEDEYKNFQIEMQTIQKEKVNKQMHLNTMREKVNELHNENSQLMDEIYNITSKLYEYEQENQTLRTQIKRENDRFPKSYFQQKMIRKPDQKPHIQEIYQGRGYIQVPENDQVKKSPRRRRGEFAKERAKNMDTSFKTNIIQNIPKGAERKNPKVNLATKKERLAQLDKELQKIADMKAINGSIRRQKINIERQMMEIEKQLKQSGEMV